MIIEFQRLIEEKHQQITKESTTGFVVDEEKYEKLFNQFNRKCIDDLIHILNQLKELSPCS